MLSHTAVDALPEGAVVIREGDAAEHLYVLLSGRLEVTLEAEGGLHLATLEPGTHFGEQALLPRPRAPRNATVQALTDVRLLRLGADQLAGLMDGDPALRKRLERLQRRRPRAQELDELRAGQVPA